MLKLTTFHERQAENTATIALVGRAKIGKTSQLLTLPTETLCLDFEAGLKAAADWRGDAIPVRSWTDAINVICLIAGPDPAKPEGQTFSQGHYQYCVENFGGIIDPTKYRIVFVDSITDLTRVAYAWAQTQVFGRGGAPDQRGAYGLLGREVVALLKHLQHANKTVVYVGGLDRRVDDLGRQSFELQTEGVKVGAELPYIVDQIVTMSDFDYDESSNTWSHNLGKGARRAFVCRSPNPWGLPAGDRSGRLDLIEEPHLGRLLDKINGTSPKGE
jgi:hypothetical protein